MGQRVQARIDLASHEMHNREAAPKGETLYPAAELFAAEAHRLDPPADRAAMSEQTLPMPAREVNPPTPPTGRAATQGEWLEEQLLLRGLSSGGLKHGPTRKTVEAALDGKYIKDGSWHAIVLSLNQEPPDSGGKIDIRDVPRTKTPPRKKTGV